MGVIRLPLLDYYENVRDGRYMCTNGRCISQSLKCDRDRDFNDQRDKTIDVCGGNDLEKNHSLSATAVRRSQQGSFAIKQLNAMMGVPPLDHWNQTSPSRYV